MRAFIVIAFAGLVLGACNFSQIYGEQKIENLCADWGFGQAGVWPCTAEYLRDDRMDMLSHDHDDRPERSVGRPDDGPDCDPPGKGHGKGKGKGHGKGKGKGHGDD